MTFTPDAQGSKGTPAELRAELVYRYGWDPNETFGYQLQISGGTPAPVNRKYF